MRQYSTVKNFVRKYPDFLSESGIRHLIFNSKARQFDHCVRRLGKRVVLDEQAVFDWVDQQKGERHVSVR